MRKSLFYSMVMLSLAFFGCSGGGGSVSNNGVPPDNNSTSNPNPGLIILGAPVSGSTVYHEEYEIYGATEPGATVTVAGLSVNVAPNGVFSSTVTLIPRDNSIDVSSTMNEQTVSIELYVYYDTIPALQYGL